ncbi:hypothetical protein [Streptomyces atratus]|uniref:hypothetical protein n=1 Tax=Streptomyces atratus TaxID=1893 RepID=UPI001300B9C6|nr:hypothetical protein [Streptomyces atratus]
MRFEITYLDADDDHVTHTADAAEVDALLAWAGRHGGKVRVRPHQPAAEPQEDAENGHTAGGTS